MSRQRAASVRLPLYDKKSNGGAFLHRSEDPDSAAYRSARVPRRRRTGRFSWFPRNLWLSPPRTLRSLFKWLVVIGLIILALFVWIWELHLEILLYRREWAVREVVKVEPLSGCFNRGRISNVYNLTEAMGPKHFEVQAGIPLRLGMDCYDFAGTVRFRDPMHPAPPRRTVTNFHTYWRSDLVSFGDRQEWTLKSFFATQDLESSRLILWSNGDLERNPMVERWLRRYPDSFQVRILDVQELAKGTAMEGSELLKTKDDKAWVDGDLVRLLVTWHHGGVWVDMDTLLTRDLAPLLDHEFVTQWDCYDKAYLALNGALMHFRQHSPYLCEAFHIMATSPPPRKGSVDWGALLYLKLWRRLVASSIPPFKVLPFCFSDGRSCRKDNRLPDPFSPDGRSWGQGRDFAEGGELDQTLNKIFAVHLHNQWMKRFPKGGWVERLLLRSYQKTLDKDEVAFATSGNAGRGKHAKPVRGG